jgi:hypothetical protein
MMRQKMTICASGEGVQPARRGPKWFDALIDIISPRLFLEQAPYGSAGDLNAQHSGQLQLTGVGRSRLNMERVYLTIYKIVFLHRNISGRFGVTNHKFVQFIYKIKKQMRPKKELINAVQDYVNTNEIDLYAVFRAFRVSVFRFGIRRITGRVFTVRICDHYPLCHRSTQTSIGRRATR